MCENYACRYTNINIKDSFNNGYLHLTEYSCINGKLKVNNSFNKNNE